MFKLRAQHANINRRGSRGLQLSLRLLDLYFRSNSSVEAAFVQIERLLVLFDRELQKLFFGVQTAGLKVIDGEIGVHAQIDRSQVRCAGLRLLAIRLNRFSNSSP